MRIKVTRVWGVLGSWMLDTGWNWMLDVSFHSLTYFCKPVSGIYTEWNC